MESINVNSINIEDYLSKEEMKDIVSKLFTAQVDAKLRCIMENCDKSLSDLVLNNMVKEYASDVARDKLTSCLETKIFDIANLPIEWEDGDGNKDSHNEFLINVQNAVGKVLQEYVDKHKSEILSKIEPNIENAINYLIDKHISMIVADSVAWKFNMRDLTMNAVKKMLDERDNRSNIES